MFGLGFGEIVIILVLALVLLGPQRLPDAAKQLGKAMRDFQKATADVKEQFETAMYEATSDVPPRPVLAPPADAASGAPSVPAGGIPAAVAVPAASADNVPGLEAALAEPAPIPARAEPRAPAAPPPAAPSADLAPKA